jgi:uncharacterized membrane protein YqhA
MARQSWGERMRTDVRESSVRIRSILAGSRFFISLAAIGTFLTSAAVLLYGVIVVIHVIWMAYAHSKFTPSSAKILAIECTELIDLFLLGTVLYIIALGLYLLFIDEDLPVPPWLKIADLDDLKEKLVGVIIVLLGVTFLGVVVEWDGSTTIWALGVAVGLVIGVLNGFIYFSRHPKEAAPGERHDAP